MYTCAQDATKAFKELITEKKDVDGLPESALALAAQQVSTTSSLTDSSLERATGGTCPWLREKSQSWI